MNIVTISGSLQVGDAITFEGVPYYSWRKKIWYAIRYMRHNNPIYKPKELRQFIVTSQVGSSYGLSPLQVPS